MKHLRSWDLYSRCGRFAEGDEYVEAALSSTCDDCRAEVMVRPVKDGGVSEMPAYVSEPDADADEVFAEAIRRREGY